MMDSRWWCVCAGGRVVSWPWLTPAVGAAAAAGLALAAAAVYVRWYRKEAPPPAPAAAGAAATTSTTAAATATGAAGPVSTAAAGDEVTDVDAGSRRQITISWGKWQLTVELPARKIRGVGDAQLTLLVRRCFGLQPTVWPLLNSLETGKTVHVGLGLPAGAYNLVLEPAPAVTAKSWIICDADTGEVLYEENAHARMQPASTAKVAAALVVLQRLAEDPSRLHETITISAFAAGEKKGTHASLAAGQQMSARDLLYGLLLPSGNDAAVALAEHFGSEFEPGDDPDRILGHGKFYTGGWAASSPVARFVAQMNRVAVQCGATNTSFVNPHGVGNADNLTTAADLAKICHEALKYDLFRQIVGSSKYKARVRPAPESNRAFEVLNWTNTNILLESVGEHWTGIKTGWIPIEQVTLGSTGRELRFVDSQRLVTWAWRGIPHLAAQYSRPSEVSVSSFVTGTDGPAPLAAINVAKVLHAEMRQTN